MPTQTPNLKLDTYNTTTDSGTKFQTFRASIAGDQTSNTTKIDKWAGEVNTKLSALEDNKSAILVSASWVSVGYYEAACESISSFKEGMLITIKLNKDSDGTTTIKINNLETKSLLKYSKSGNTTNIVAGDLKINKEYSFRYDGTSLIWQNANSGDQINVSGTQGNVMSISLNNTIEDSGVSIGSGQISTIDKTIVGSINELKTGMDDNASEISILSGNAIQYRGVFSGDTTTLVNKEHEGNWYIVIPATGLPTGETGGYLQVIYNPNGSNYCKHIFRNYTNSITYENTLYNGAWKGWKQIATIDKTLNFLDNTSSDMNTFIKNGIVMLPAFCTNAPPTLGNSTEGYMQISVLNERLIIQEFTSAYPNKFKFIRNRIDGVWSIWTNAATTDKIDILFPFLPAYTGEASYASKVEKVNNLVTITTLVKKVDNTEMIASEICVASLPVGYRPSKYIGFSAVGYTGSSTIPIPVVAWVQPGGSVNLFPASTLRYVMLHVSFYV